MSNLSRRSFLKGSAITAAAFALAACRAEEASEAPVLNLYNWVDYINPDTLTGFTRATGLRTSLATFESNEEMVAALDNNPGQYDLVSPSDDTVRRLIRDKKLQSLDKSLLPNFNNISERFRVGRPYDPNSDYSVTKDWGTTGLVWRPDSVAETFASWADFWAIAPRYSGKITVIDSQDEVIGIALKLLGYSLNDGEAGHLSQARDQLMELKPHVVVTSDYIDKFADRTVVLAIGWNGDAAQINANLDTPVNYVIPAEGSILWADNWCIPQTALHPKNAHAFINYLLQPEVAAAEAAYIGYATVVTEALPLLDPAVQNDPMIYPPEDSMARLETQSIPDASAAQRAEIWAEFAAA